MLTRELLSQVHRLEIRTRRLVNEIFSGAYSSVFRGLGMEFSEVREYVADDDIRAIDWNVTARMNHPYVKKFMAEREMTVLLMVDASASMRFGTASKLKSELAAELAAVLGFSAIRNNDKVGLLLFSDHVESYVRPQKGRTHTLRLIRDVLEFRPQRRLTHIDEALRYLNRVLKRRAVVFLLSDFLAPARPVWEKLLAVTNRRHDLVALQVLDPRELAIPTSGLLAWEDAESGAPELIDAADAGARRRIEQAARDRQCSLEALFRRHGIDHIPLRTDRSFVAPLVEFFRLRVKRVR